MKTLFTVITLLGAAVLSAQKAQLMPPLSHARDVSAVAVSPDGRYVLSVAGSSDNTVMMWSVADGRLLKILQGHSNPIREAAFSPQTQRIATLEKNSGKLFLWTNSGQFLDTLKTDFFLTSTCFTPDGRQILAGNSSEGKLLLCDLSGAILKTYPGGTSAITKVAYAPNGKYFASGDESGMVRLYRSDGVLLKTMAAHSGESVRFLAFSPNSTHMLSTDADGDALIWNTADLSITRKLNAEKERVSVACFSPDGLFVATSDPNNSECSIWSTKDYSHTHFNAGSFGINDIVFAPDSKSVFICGFDKGAKQVDLQGKLLRVYTNEASPVSSAAFSHDGAYILTGGNGINLRLWNLNNRQVHHFDGKQEFDTPAICSPTDNNFIVGQTGPNFLKVTLDSFNLDITSLPKTKYAGVSAMAYSHDGKYFLAADFVGNVQCYDAQNGKPVWSQPFHADSNYVCDLEFSPDDRYFLTAYNNQFSPTVMYFTEMSNQPFAVGRAVYLHDAASGKVVHQFGTDINCAVFSPDGKWIAGNEQGELRIWNISGDSLFYTCDDRTVTSLAFSPDSKKILLGFAENTAHLYSLEGKNPGKFITEYRGHLSSIRNAGFSPDGRYVITGSSDNTAKVWDIGGQEIVTLISIGTSDWLVMSPNGLFDASPGAMQKLYVVQDLEVIELDQIKNRYFEPGLLQKVFSPERINLRKAGAFSDLALYPEIAANIKGEILNVHLTPRSGGLGVLSLYINDKEVKRDINLAQDTILQENLSAYTRYYTASRNTISLRAYNKEGWLKSPAVELSYTPAASSLSGRGNGPGAGTSGIIANSGDPALYAIIIGTSHYSNTAISLKYPDADAISMADAIQKTASLLFTGAGKLQVRLLTTATQNPDSISSKANIEKAFRDVAAKAHPEDIVVVYLSGHGTTFGEAEKSQFYYLTKDMQDQNVQDPDIRLKYTISTEDLTQWLTAIPALKQVMMIDACNSGKFTEAFTQGRSVDPSQVVAIDRMKDRTGMFILAGSAADQKSYEANVYGHGLLTYTLLEGINGKALRDRKLVDVMTLFQYARDQVPVLASGLRGIQEPVPVFPTKGGSFDIGISDGSLKISLPTPKILFTKSDFQDEDRYFDVLGMGKALDSQFELLTAKGASSDILFSPLDFYESGYSIRGRYAQQGNAITVKGKLYKGSKPVEPNSDFQVQGSSDNFSKLVGDIGDAVTELLNNSSQ